MDQRYNLIGEHHELVSGMTGSGKTYYATRRAALWPGRALFWLPRADPLAATWSHADRRNESADLFRAKRGRVAYEPHYDRKVAETEAAVIVRYLMTRPQPWNPPVLLIIDEADILARQGSSGTAWHEVAFRGRKQGVWATFVTLHPAELDKGLVRNCQVHTYFPNPYAVRYYDSQGIDGAQIVQRLQAAPPYSFMRWEMGSLSGPHRL